MQGLSYLRVYGISQETTCVTRGFCHVYRIDLWYIKEHGYPYRRESSKQRLQDQKHNQAIAINEPPTAAISSDPDKTLPAALSSSLLLPLKASDI